MNSVQVQVDLIYHNNTAYVGGLGKGSTAQIKISEDRQEQV